MSFQVVANSLPAVPRLRQISIAIAALDAIVVPEWEYRYYSHDASWGGGSEELGSMRDGSGNEYGVVFTGQGAFIRGFDHESQLSPWKRTPPYPYPGLFEGLPPEFLEFAEEVSFTLNEVPAFTSCYWNCGDEGEGWSFGALRDLDLETPGIGDSKLFVPLTNTGPAFYVEHALAAYEKRLDLEAVASIYELSHMTEEVILRLNPEASLEDVQDELATIGYPGSMLI